MKSRIAIVSKGLIALTLLLSTLMVASDLYATVVRLNKGTEVKLKFQAEGRISSGNHVKGDSIDIVLTKPIIIDDSTIVETGATGKAVVVAAEKNGKAGKPGYIKLRFVYLLPKGAFKTAGDAPILLSGEDIENKGKGKKTLSYLLIFGLFIKGGNGEIDKNTVYTVEVAESIKLDSK